MCKTYAEFYNCSSLAHLRASASTISCGLVYLSHKTALYQYVMNHYNSIRLLHLHHSFACDVWNSPNQERSQARHGHKKPNYKAEQSGTDLSKK